MTENMNLENYGPGTPCSHCGDEIEDSEVETAEYCRKHRERAKKPCGNYHPLPCGVDKKCAYLQLEKDLRGLIKEWRSFDEPTLPRCQGAKVAFESAADELEELIDE